MGRLLNKPKFPSRNIDPKMIHPVDLAERFLQLQSLQVRPKFFAQALALEGELDCGFQEAEFVTGVVAAALVDTRVHFFLLQKPAQTVGELELSAGTGRDAAQRLDHGGREKGGADP